MSTFSLFVVALAIAVFHISNINGMKDFDIENVYEHLGRLHKKGFSLQRAPEYQSQEREKNIRDAILQLIQNIARSPQVRSGYKENDFVVNKKDPRNEYGRYRYLPWRPYLYVKPQWLKAIYTPRKRTHRLDNMKQLEDVNRDVDDYSKIYLVLNPEADITESDVRDISNMVSSVLSQSKARRKSSLNNNMLKMRRYKGFVVRDHRRRLRDSKELFALKDSVEDYKPKRPRGDYGVGIGRTAIPYIRHRGDIFEKE